MLKHRKRLLLIVVFLVIVVVAGLFLSSHPRKEPQYQGRYLSEWLHDLLPQPNATDPEVGAAARRAIEEIGTNGLPTYFAWLKPSPWKESVFNKLPLRLKQNPSLADWLVLNDMRRQQLALQGFWILGTNAAPAIPELCSLMRNQNDPNLSSQISFALGGIGPVAIPALRSAFADPQQSNREKIFSSILMLSLREGSNECLPIITAALEDPNPMVRALATNRFKWTGGNNVFDNPDALTLRAAAPPR